MMSNMPWIGDYPRRRPAEERETVPDMDDRQVWIAKRLRELHAPKIGRLMWFRHETEGWVPNMLSDALGGMLLNLVSSGERFVRLERVSPDRWSIDLTNPERTVFGQTLAEVAGMALLHSARGDIQQNVTTPELGIPGE